MEPIKEFWHELVDDNRVPPQFGYNNLVCLCESQTCALKVVTSDSHCEKKTHKILRSLWQHMGLWWFGMNFPILSLPACLPACQRLNSNVVVKLEGLKPQSTLSVVSQFNFLLLYKGIFLIHTFFWLNSHNFINNFSSKHQGGGGRHTQI